ncbi:MAG: hypothetical protein V2J65_02650 [Desulfobacteraceae bacterium]|jgi:hypothetical protein|nr:hypothetical protein [Desulfobacteraceae bacterium]
MIKKHLLDARRIRRIDGGFSFIPHRFLTDGFLSALDADQLLVYFFLVLAGDRYGLSFYSCDSICGLLKISTDRYLRARDALIEKDLIAFDGSLFQVLDLPAALPVPHSRHKSPSSRANHQIKRTLKEVPA